MKPFRPGLIPTLVVLALLPGLIALGCWQLRRADEKRDLLATYTERQIEAPVTADRLRQLPDPAFYPVHLYGRFDAGHSLLLDNQMRDGKAGVELLQPFHDQASGLWLLVNRGWLAWPDRRVPVRFDTPSQALALDATVYVPPGKTFQLHPDNPDGQWPQLLTAIEPVGLWQQLGREGFAQELRLQPGPAAYRLTGRWSPWARKSTRATPCSGSPWPARWSCSTCISAGITTTRRTAMAAATSPLDVPDRRKPRGRLQLLLILFVVLGPMILATSMYKLKFWVPEGRSYHGVMIGNGEGRADIGIDAQDERWQLLVSAPGACAEECRQLVYLARQIQVGLGRDASRASHALAAAQPLAADYQALLGREYPQLQRYPLDAQRYIQKVGDTAPQLWIVDPHGNLVLRYDAKVKGKHVLDDLRHLLKLSNIG